MTRPEIHLTGMPYVPGTARGVLQRGMTGQPGGRIVILEQPPSGPLTHPPAGFVMIDAAPLSHALIPLLGSGVPTVIITRAQAAALREGSEVVLDGATGRISTDITSGDQAYPPPAPTAASTTTDGVPVRLRVSARDLLAVQRALASGAEAIGLVRSEFLTPGEGQPPDAAFYRRAFRALCTAAGSLPVTIRLIDIAADKHPGWLRACAESGGVLGLQGVRGYREEPLQGIYRAQLEAIDALAGEYKLQVLLPYVADLEELRYWRDDIGRRLRGSVPIGAMAETPAAALQIGEWLDEADFVAVGCNDLMQCLFGADRDRPELRRYLDPHAPPLYRFLRRVAEAAGEGIERVQLCGVLPQLPGILPVLLGLGFSTFSVEAILLAYLRRDIARTTMTDARVLASRVCAARDSREVEVLLGLKT